MQTILSDFSAPALVHAIRVNWVDYYACLGRAPNAELSAGPHLTWLLTGVPNSFLNVVMRTQLPPNRAGKVVDETLAHFRSRNVKLLSWWAETDTPRAELNRHLIARGLTFEKGGTGMAADLTALREDLPSPVGLTINRVEDSAALKQWTRVSRIGFGTPEAAEERLFELFSDSAFEPHVQCYLAVLNGQPVATSQFFLSAGVAGIYNVTCLPEARGQGIGAAIALAPLLEARRRGYRIGILQASSMGYPVYLRLGFQEYGRLNFYLWKNEPESPDAEHQRG